MKHSYSIKIITLLLFFSNSLVSCYNLSLNEQKPNIAINPEKHVSQNSTKAGKITELSLAKAILDSKQQHKPAAMFADAKMWHTSAMHPKQNSISSTTNRRPDHLQTIEDNQVNKPKPAIIGIQASIDSQSSIENSLKHKKITLPATKQTNRTITFIAKGGHRITLYPQANRWRGKVNENLPTGFSRKLSLPVYGNSSLIVQATLAMQSQDWYKQHIHVIFPEQDHKTHQGFIYVGKLGLMGGTTIEWKPESKVAAARILGDSSSKDKEIWTNLGAGMYRVKRTIVNKYKEVVYYAKEALVSKEGKVAKPFCNHTLNSATKFIWKNQKLLLRRIGGTGILALMVAYPRAGIMLLQGDITVLFGSQEFGAAIAGWGASLGIVSFFDSLIWHQKANIVQNKAFQLNCNSTVSATGDIRPSIPIQKLTLKAPVPYSHKATWQEVYTKLKSYKINFTQTITGQLANFKSLLLEQAYKLWSCFSKENTAKNTMSPLPGSAQAFVHPSFANPIPTPARQPRETNSTVSSKTIANNKPTKLPANHHQPSKATKYIKQPQQVKKEQSNVQRQPNRDEKEKISAVLAEEIVEEEIRLENLPEAKVVVEKYLQDLRQSAPNNQTELHKKGKALLSAVENLKKITKEQYRTIGRIFILADIDEHSWPLLLEQEKALKYKYTAFKALRNQLQAAIPLSKAALRACGVRLHYTLATGEEDLYSSDEGQNYSDQSIRIKQALGTGISSALKQHVQIMLPSLLRLVIDPKGKLQNYIDLIQSIPELPELLQKYYHTFHHLNEEERAAALGQLLTEVLLTLTPTRKLGVGQLATLKRKLGKAANKVALRLPNN